MKMLFSILAICALTACGSTDKDKNDGNSNEKPTDTTDYSVCDRGTPANSAEGNWMHRFTQDEIDFTTFFQISRGSFSITTQCEMMGLRLRATTSSPITMNSSQITVWNDSTKTEHYDDGDIQADCTANLARGTMTYTFRGACLVLRSAGSGESFTLVPN